MKKSLLLFAFLQVLITSAQTPCNSGSAGAYPCNGLTLQSFLSLSSMGATTGTDSWGWTDPQTGTEYALMGVNNGTVFIDISDPFNPKNLGKLRGHNNSSSSWRDIKTYKNHAYIVSEASGHGMQVFDLTILRNYTTANPNRTFSETAFFNGVTASTPGGFGSAHNIIINEDTGVACIVGTSRGGASRGGPWFIDITTPASPTLLGIYKNLNYTHDAQLVTYNGPDSDYTGKEIFIGSNEDKIVILDVSNKSNITFVSSIDYLDFAYTHQGWFTEDERYFILGDEEDEIGSGFNTRTIVFDFTDLDNPIEHFKYYGPTQAIDHNGYVKGNRFYQASYEAGIRIINISDIANKNITEINSFDTYPEANSANFHGVWNIYPYFESGNLLVSDYTRGFFLIKDPNYDNTPPVANCKNFTAKLDKTTGTVTINVNQIDNGSTDNMAITKKTLTGRTIFTCADVGKNFDVTLTVEDDYGNKSSCTSTVSVAAANTNFNGTAWNNGAPGPGSNARIRADYNTASKGNITACTCEVDASKTLTVAEENYLDIARDITVNGNLVVEHKGSVVQTQDDATVINNGSINVNYTTPFMVPRTFLVMGSPMTTETRTGVFAASHSIRNHLTENFVPNPDVEAQFPGAENFADDNYDNWLLYNGTINPGEGYLVRPQESLTEGNKTYDLTYQSGTLNTGTVEFTVKYNVDRDSSPNVLSNPYPSAISAVDFINANPMVNEVYFWNPLTPPNGSLPGAGSMNFSMEDISMYNLLGGTAAASDATGTETIPTGYISTGEGFGIKATSAGIASFNNSMRVTGNNNVPRPTEGNDDRIWLTVHNDKYGLQNTTLLGFSEITTSGMDQGYDSKRLATVLSLYSHLEDGSQELGIQAREAFTDGAKIPMGFSSLLDDTAEYRISITDIQGVDFENISVFLFDNQLNTVTNLSETDYTFVAAKGTYNNRFTVQFQSDEVLGPIATALRNISMYPNPTQSLVTINSPQSKIVNIEVYDISGRKLRSTPVIGETSYSIDLHPLQTAVYFIKINTEAGTVTKQIIKD